MSKRAIDLKSSSGIVGRSENTNRFYRDIVRYQTLTPEEEYDLFNKLRHGTPKERKRAKEQLVNCNQRFVVGCAKKWATESTLMDYVNEGNFGLMEAIDTFDETLGFKFSTYAVHYIKRALVNYQQQTSNMVRPSNFSKTQLVKSKAINKFTQKHEREPTETELMEFMNKSVKRKILDTRDLADVRYTYIDAEGLNGDDSSSYDAGIDDYNKRSASANQFEVTERQAHNKELIKSLIHKLSKKEQRVLTLRYGIDNGIDNVKTELGQGEIADIMGLTQERVRQIENEAVKKLQELCKKEKVVYA